MTKNYKGYKILLCLYMYINQRECFLVVILCFFAFHPLSTISQREFWYQWWTDQDLQTEYSYSKSVHFQVLVFQIHTPICCKTSMSDDQLTGITPFLWSHSWSMAMMIHSAFFECSISNAYTFPSVEISQIYNNPLEHLQQNPILSAFDMWMILMGNWQSTVYVISLRSLPRFMAYGQFVSNVTSVINIPSFKSASYALQYDGFNPTYLCLGTRLY